MRGAVLGDRTSGKKFVPLTWADVDSRLLGEINLKAERLAPVLQNASVIRVPRLAGRGAEIDDLAFLRTPEIAAVGVALPDIDAIDEPHFRAEIRRIVLVIGVEEEMAAAV